MRFVVRRVVVLKIARNRLNIRFGHCTSCLFDNSSVKLCKHDTPLLFAPSGANHEQGLGWDRVCEAQRSNESPSGAFKRQNGLRQQMEGPRPDKFADVYTSALLADAIKPLNVLSKIENHFAIRTVRFQVQLEADGYFLQEKFFAFATAASRASRYHLASFEPDFLQIQLQNTCWASPKPDVQQKIALTVYPR